MEPPLGSGSRTAGAGALSSSVGSIWIATVKQRRFRKKGTLVHATTITCVLLRFVANKDQNTVQIHFVADPRSLVLFAFLGNIESCKASLGCLFSFKLCLDGRSGVL